MKTRWQFRNETGRRAATVVGFWIVGALLIACAPAQAQETNNLMTPEQVFEGGTNTYNNWVELSVAGLATHGSEAQAQQSTHLGNSIFGGIEDLHLQQNVAKNTTLTIDGRAIVDNHDYKLNVGLAKENLGFVRFDFENFRTWYNDAGGYYPPTGIQYTRSEDALALDRGQVSFTAGLTLPDLPKITFKYTHRYREGDKGSTSWGPVHPDGTAAVRGLYPSFYSIDEKADIFELNATHRVKATDLGLGLRYETGDLSDSRKMTLWDGEPVQRKVTNREGTSYDFLNVHAFTETWIKNNLFFSSGFLFANLDNDFSGSRIYGDQFNVSSLSPLNGLGYTNLNGGSHEHQYVLNLNLMSVPLKDFTIVPSLRVQKEDWNANSRGDGTLGTGTGTFTASGNRDVIDVTERLDARYTGVTNWVFYAGGEWTQGDGNLHEHGGLSQIDGIGVAPVQQTTDDSRFFQKYSAGARWYPARSVTVDFGGYYEKHHYDYNNTVDSTPNDASSANRYPAYLVLQEFDTYDAKARLTFRPWQNVSLMSRYEYQWSTVHTKPAAVSGLGEAESARMGTHIFSQNIGWTPWSRLNLSVGFDYVLSNLKTPAADLTQAVQYGQNDYWTLNFSSGIVLDSKTDLNLGYFFYQSDNYKNNSLDGVPLGASATEHGVTAMLVRRINKNLRLNLRYAYFNYDDVLSGGHNNFEAHVVSSGLQYRF